MVDITLGPFPGGMNNRQRDYALPPGYIRNGVNVRVDNSGFISRRDGLEKVCSGVDTKNGFDCPMGVVFREGTTIKRFNDDNTATTLFEGAYGYHCAYLYLNGIIYFSDGLMTKKILSDWSVTEWGMENPSSPTIHGGSGIYGSGKYLAAVTFVDDTGTESGASDYVSVELNDNNGIYFTNIPTTIDPQVVGVRLYLSTANSGANGKVVLFQIAELPVGSVSYSQTIGNYDENKKLETEFVSKPPPGRIIREFNGIIYIADDTGIVWHTEPMQYDHFKLSENFLQFPDAPTIMEPVLDGMWFVHGDVTDFYFGASPADFSPKTILRYGAVFGTSVVVEKNKTVRWFSNRGAVVASAGGEIVNNQEDNVATDTADSGASILKEEDGIRQFITSLKNTEVSTLAARDFMEAEIIRKGA